MRLPDTSTQRYLRELNACYSGRIATGRKTLSEMFNTTKSSTYLAWFVLKMVSQRDGYGGGCAVGRDPHYRCPKDFTPAQMREWAKTFNLTIPLGV